MALQKLFTECGGKLHTANVFFKYTQNISVKYIFGNKDVLGSTPAVTTSSELYDAWRMHQIWECWKRQ